MADRTLASGFNELVSIEMHGLNAILHGRIDHRIFPTRHVRQLAGQIFAIEIANASLSVGNSTDLTLVVDADCALDGVLQLLFWARTTIDFDLQQDTAIGPDIRAVTAADVDVNTTGLPFPTNGDRDDFERAAALAIAGVISTLPSGSFSLPVGSVTATSPSRVPPSDRVRSFAHGTQRGTEAISLGGFAASDPDSVPGSNGAGILQNSETVAIGISQPSARWLLDQVQEGVALRLPPTPVGISPRDDPFTRVAIGKVAQRAVGFLRLEGVPGGVRKVHNRTNGHIIDEPSGSVTIAASSSDTIEFGFGWSTISCPAPADGPVEKELTFTMPTFTTSETGEPRVTRHTLTAEATSRKVDVVDVEIPASQGFAWRDCRLSSTSGDEVYFRLTTGLPTHCRLEASVAAGDGHPDQIEIRTRKLHAAGSGKGRAELNGPTLRLANGFLSLKVTGEYIVRQQWLPNADLELTAQIAFCPDPSTGRVRLDVSNIQTDVDFGILGDLLAAGATVLGFGLVGSLMAPLTPVLGPTLGGVLGSGAAGVLTAGGIFGTDAVEAALENLAETRIGNEIPNVGFTAPDTEMGVAFIDSVEISAAGLRAGGTFEGGIVHRAGTSDRTANKTTVGENGGLSLTTGLAIENAEDSATIQAGSDGSVLVQGVTAARVVKAPPFPLLAERDAVARLPVTNEQRTFRLDAGSTLIVRTEAGRVAKIQLASNDCYEGDGVPMRFVTYRRTNPDPPVQIEGEFEGYPGEVHRGEFTAVVNDDIVPTGFPLQISWTFSVVPPPPGPVLDLLIDRLPTPADLVTNVTTTVLADDTYSVEAPPIEGSYIGYQVQTVATVVDVFGDAYQATRVDLVDGGLKSLSDLIGNIALREPGTVVLPPMPGPFPVYRHQYIGRLDRESRM